MGGRKRKTPWQRIIAAADKGTGCRLTADDCLRLSCDTAIEQRAALDDQEDEEDDEDEDEEPEGILHGWTPVEILSRVVSYLDEGYGPNPGDDALRSLNVTRADIGVPNPYDTEEEEE